MTTLMSFGYFPYITIPSRITNCSRTCKDHVSIKLSYTENILKISSGLFYCEIGDLVPCFISITINKACCAGKRHVTRLFVELKFNYICSKPGVRKLE